METEAFELVETHELPLEQQRVFVATVNLLNRGGHRFNVGGGPWSSKCSFERQVDQYYLFMHVGKYHGGMEISVEVAQKDQPLYQAKLVRHAKLPPAGGHREHLCILAFTPGEWQKQVRYTQV